MEWAPGFVPFTRASSAGPAGKRVAACLRGAAPSSATPRRPEQRSEPEGPRSRVPGGIAKGGPGKRPPLARREGEKRIQWQRNAGTNRATCLSMLKRRARGGCRGTRLLTNETTDAAMAYPDASQKRKKPAQGRPGELIQIERKDSARKVLSGGSCRIRTYDQLVKSQLLYQLS